MIVLNDFRKFVPSTVCLVCDGCCRFQEEKSVWRPRPAREEISLCRCYAQSLDDEGYLKTHPAAQGAFCRFFSPDDSHCQIYQNRPLECQLYPFILTRSGPKVFLSAHTFCPHVQCKKGTQEFSAYIEYLKGFLAQPEVLGLIRRNPELAGDYQGHEGELLTLFELPAVPSTSGDDLMTHKETIQRFLEQTKPELSPFSFVSIFLWKDYFDFELREIDKNLCVFASHGLGTFLYLPPLGKTISPKAVRESFAFMNTKNKNPGISRVENVPESRLSFFPATPYAHYKKSNEFLYERRAIVDMPGPSFKSKRNACNHFIKSYRASYVPYETRMQSQCQALYETWAQQRFGIHEDVIYRQMLKENYQVHGLALRNHQELDLTGRVVLIDGELCGYTFGYALDKDVFCVLFEITDLGKRGLSAYIFREFCADAALKDFRWINGMDDFGADNLTTTKLSFRPSRSMPMYVITQQPVKK